MKKYLLFFLFFVLLSGCGTKEKYQGVMKEYANKK